MIELPMNECTFKFFDNTMKEVPFGKHVPWLFEVEHESIDSRLVTKIELPILNYTSTDNNVKVKIWVDEFETEEEKEDFEETLNFIRSKLNKENNKMNTIKFYKVKNEKYGCFSNFSPHGFTDSDGFYWKTSEHYYQAKKFLKFDLQERIRQVTSPRQTADIGRDRTLPLRKDWEQVKDSVMKEALLYKFLQNDDIKEILLSTSDSEIIEDSPIDYYWGCGKDGSGKNMLGKLLVEVREYFRNKQK